MGLRRGFKTEATGLAKEIRGELGLGPFDRLDLGLVFSIPTHDGARKAALGGRRRRLAVCTRVSGVEVADRGFGRASMV